MLARPFRITLALQNNHVSAMRLDGQIVNRPDVLCNLKNKARSLVGKKDSISPTLPSVKAGHRTGIWFRAAHMSRPNHRGPFLGPTVQSPCWVGGDDLLLSWFHAINWWIHSNHAVTSCSSCIFSIKGVIQTSNWQ